MQSTTSATQTDAITLRQQTIAEVGAHCQTVLSDLITDLNQLLPEGYDVPQRELDGVVAAVMVMVDAILPLPKLSEMDAPKATPVFACCKTPFDPDLVLPTSDEDDIEAGDALCVNCFTECDDCGDWVRNHDFLHNHEQLGVASGGVCSDCAVECQSCCEQFTPKDAEAICERDGGSFDAHDFYCDACAEVCDDCNERGDRDAMIEHEDTWFCHDCTTTCDGCDVRVPSRDAHEIAYDCYGCDNCADELRDNALRERVREAADAISDVIQEAVSKLDGDDFGLAQKLAPSMFELLRKTFTSSVERVARNIVAQSADAEGK